MPNTAEICKMDYSPCSKATRRAVYDNARRCKRVVKKKCIEKGTKKMCKLSKEGISRLRKKQLCTYILKNPAYRTEGHVAKENFVVEPRRTFGKSIQQHFFTPVEVKEIEAGTIRDVHRILYLAKYAGPKTAIYNEIVTWTNYDKEEEEIGEFTLFIPDDFDSFLRSAKRRGVERIFLNVRLYARLPDGTDEDSSKHANFLFFDLQNKLLYRYEPSGFSMYDVFDMDKMDDELRKYAIRKSLKYVPPFDSCPTQLFAKVAAAQRVAGLAKKEQTDPGGFCKVWSTFVLEQKLRNPQMDFNEIHRHFTKVFLDQNIDVTHFARMYIQRVNQSGQEILRRHGWNGEEDINDYMDENWDSLMKMAVSNGH